jgi:mono/diheme cytochrome c family protein
MAMKGWGVGFALAVLASGASSALAAGDQTRGSEIARQWCSECHATETTGGGTDAAPPWQAIALDPAKDEAYLTEFLKNPHPAMRHIPLTERDIDDVVAYIRALAFE